MGPALVRRSFLLFQLVLGLTLLVASIQTLLHALAPENFHTHTHIALIAAVEGVGAVLFLVPRTLRLGALVLVFTIGFAFLIHTIQGVWRPDLAIYTAGAWLVFVHGSAWPAGASASDAAA